MMAITRKKFEKQIAIDKSHLRAVSLMRHLLLMIDEPFMPIKVAAKKEIPQLDMDICNYRLGLLPFDTKLKEFTEDAKNIINVHLKNTGTTVRAVLSDELETDIFYPIVKNQVLFYMNPGSQLELVLTLEKGTYKDSYKYSLVENLSLVPLKTNPERMKITFYCYCNDVSAIKQRLNNVLKAELDRLYDDMNTQLQAQLNSVSTSDTP